MRPIKIQFWDSESSEMIQLWTNSDFEVFFSKEWEMEIYSVFEWSDGGWEHNKREWAIRQFTGLLDKKLAYIYDMDIIDLHWNIVWNFYENSNLLKTDSNFLIKGMGTKEWENSYSEAYRRWCEYAK